MDKYLQIYKAHMEKVEEVLYKSVENLAILREPIEYFLGSGGKRIRPLIGIILNLTFSGNPETIINKCAAVELIHTASLMHDDIIDESSERRGVPTVHVKYGVNKAILAGDVLVVKALELMHPFDKEFLNFAETCYRMAVGEAKTDYIENIKGKTAALFELIAYCSTSDIDIEENMSKQIRRFGLLFGLIFQMRDDFLDGKCDRDFDKYYNEAREIVEGFPKNEHSENLLEILSYSTKRKY